MKHVFSCLVVVLGLAACDDSGADRKPILDGAPGPTYDRDIAACQHLARSQAQFDQETAAAALIGAGIGAVLGEIDSESDALSGAVAGGIVGGGAAALDASQRRDAIVVECLRGRGHNVVG